MDENSNGVISCETFAIRNSTEKFILFNIFFFSLFCPLAGSEDSVTAGNFDELINFHVYNKFLGKLKTQKYTWQLDFPSLLKIKFITVRSPSHALLSQLL